MVVLVIVETNKKSTAFLSHTEGPNHHTSIIAKVPAALRPRQQKNLTRPSFFSDCLSLKTWCSEVDDVRPSCDWFTPRTSNF